MMTTTVGERFAQALLAKDWDAVADTVSPELEFRALTPGRIWETATSAELVDRVLRLWFGPGEEIYDAMDITDVAVADRRRISYRFKVRNSGGDYLCEQTAYYASEDGRITTLSLACSGFRPLAAER